MQIKVLLISDKPDWAYSTIAEEICKHNTDKELSLTHLTCKKDANKIRKHKSKYDFYFLIGWQIYENLKFLDKKRTLVGIHSHQSFDNRRTTPEKDVNPSQKTLDYLSEFKAVNVVSKRLLKIFTTCGLNVTYTRNGVDTDIFTPVNRTSARFSAGCAASIKNDWNKGFFTLIEPACKFAEVKAIGAMIDTNRRNHEKMPIFYNKIDCYICASRAEGMSLSVLEAASCGCVILSTKVGDNTILIKNGENGFFVERSINDICNKLIYLKNHPIERIQMSNNMRKTVKNEWSWERNIKDWLCFIKKSIL